MTPIEAASQAFGQDFVPESQTIFSPSAFRNAQTISDRALRTRQALKTMTGMMETESRIRDEILRSQERQTAASRLMQEQELIDAQPALRAEIDSIDPLDDNAEEKLAQMEGFVTSVQDRRKLGALRITAANMRKEKAELFDRLQVLGDRGQAEARFARALDAARNGDYLAFRREAVDLPSLNEVTSRIAESNRRAESARKLEEDSRKTLASFGIPSPNENLLRDAIRKEIEPFKSSGVNPDKFLTDPRAAYSEYIASRAPEDRDTSVPRALESIVRRYEQGREALATVREGMRRRAESAAFGGSGSRSPAVLPPSSFLPGGPSAP